jgi:hypothetical protein
MFCIYSSYGDGLMQVHPPSITSVWPVICLAFDETKNKAAAAMSDGVAGRPMGVIRDQVLS